MNNFKFEEPTDFNDYIKEDKSRYKTATEAGYYDPDNDFLIGDSGGFLLNINFTFTNVHLLNVQARAFTEQGYYIDSEIDSPVYTRFRLREEDFRKTGYIAPCKKLRDGTVAPLRITGEHYNFLNYGRMIRLTEVTGTGKTGNKAETFPEFIDAQYWWFKIKEFTTNNGFNEIVCKTRRGGFSYSEAIDTANEVNLNPKMTVILAAFDKKYLTQGNAISPMALNQLVFYENHTPFRRSIMRRDLEDICLGFKDEKNNDAGYQSKILVVSAANPDAAVGKDGTKVKVEEMGTLSTWEAFATQTMPTLRTGSYITGKLTAFGTVNSDNTCRDLFADNFFNPAKWFFMPFENVWDKGKRNSVCGYYKPYWWGLEGEIDGVKAMDENGNTNYDVAIKIVENEQRYKWENSNTLSEFSNYIGQYGNRPQDSFGAAFNNIFVSEGLTQHINNVKHNKKTFDFYRDGVYQPIYEQGSTTGSGRIIEVKFKTHEELYHDNLRQDIHPYITRLKPDPKLDNYGCVREYAPPLRDPASNKVYDNLYRIWVDPYGVDKMDNKEITDDNSFGAIGVYMKPTNLHGDRGDKLVALFVGRPPKQEDFNRIALYMAYRYNAKVFTENDRGSIVQDFKHWKQVSKLVGEPSLAWDTSLAGANGREYGISMGQGSSNRRLTGIVYHKEWLYTVRGVNEFGDSIYNYHTINDIGILDEYANFSVNGNFDRISMLNVGAYDIKELAYNLQTFVDGEKIKPKDPNSIFNRRWF